jgi:hypothetical protein
MECIIFKFGYKSLIAMIGNRAEFYLPINLSEMKLNLDEKITNSRTRYTSGLGKENYQG